VRDPRGLAASRSTAAAIEAAAAQTTNGVIGGTGEYELAFSSARPALSCSWAAPAGPDGSESLTTVLMTFGRADLLITLVRSASAGGRGDRVGVDGGRGRPFVGGHQHEFLLVPNRWSCHPLDQSRPFGHGREAYGWSLFAALT